jgi:hypothetical protein
VPDNYATHEVFNQPEPLADYDLFAGNAGLQDALRFNAPQLDTAPLQATGRRWGSRDLQVHARLANVHAPQLRTHDRFGRRIDEVEFHPSYHVLMAEAVGAGLHGAPWAAARRRRTCCAPPASAVHRARAVGAVPRLDDVCVTAGAARQCRDLRRLDSRLTSRALRPRAACPWRAKPGLTMGMGMTEKQGGSDVRANTTRAEPDGDDAWGRALCASPATSGSSRRPCATPSWCWRRRPRACRACSCRACCPMAAQRHPHPAPEGQAGQQGQRQLRGRVPRRHGLAGRRRGPRHPADPGDGHADAARLRAGHHRPDAPGAVAGARPHPPAPGVRQAADRPAADAQRAGRPGAGKRGGHRAGVAAGPRLRPSR